MGMDSGGLVKKGFANLWKGKEAVGGTLYLTENSLLHKAHKMNIQTKDVEIKINDIDRIDVYTSKVFGIPLVKNGLLVVDKMGKEYRFVVNGREKWKQEIKKFYNDDGVL